MRINLGAYDRLGWTDSIVSVSENTYTAFCELGYPDVASRYYAFAIEAYSAKGEYEKARHCMEVYEKESGYFDSNNNIETGRESYYDIKAKYYLAVGCLDSAEYYLRRELNEGKDLNNQNMASRGLSLLYRRMHVSDSAAKYALYSYDMVDSVYRQMITTDIERLQVMFDYSHHQHLAQQEKERANRERGKARTLLCVMLGTLFAGGGVIYRLREKRKAEQVAYKNKVDELERIQTDVLRLRSHETELDRLLEEKETKMKLLVQEMTHYWQKENLTKASAEHLLQQSPIYQDLLKKAGIGKLLTENDWHEINKLVIEVLPGFHHFVSGNQYILGLNEYRTVILVRLHIKPKPISNLLGVTPQYITKLSKQLLEKLFHETGNGKYLEEKVIDIT